MRFVTLLAVAFAFSSHHCMAQTFLPTILAFESGGRTKWNRGESTDFLKISAHHGQQDYLSFYLCHGDKYAHPIEEHSNCQAIGGEQKYSEPKQQYSLFYHRKDLQDVFSSQTKELRQISKNKASALLIATTILPWLRGLRVLSVLCKSFFNLVAGTNVASSTTFGFILTGTAAFTVSSGISGAAETILGDFIYSKSRTPFINPDTLDCEEDYCENYHFKELVEFPSNFKLKEFKFFLDRVTHPSLNYISLYSTTQTKDYREINCGSYQSQQVTCVRFKTEIAENWQRRARRWLIK